MPRKIQLSEPPPRLQVKILSSHCIGDEIYILRLSPPDLSWVPGDCIAVYGPNQSPISRPYSLSGSVKSPYLELWVRRFAEGEISSYLCDRRVGDSIEISPPFGWFRPAEPVEAEKIYFATGTGIAPFLSALRSGAAAPVHFYWGVRHALKVEIPFTVNTFYSQSIVPGAEKGRFTQVVENIPFSGKTHFYACGVDQMIEDVLGHFASRGVEESRLHRECFFTAQAEGASRN